MTADPGRYSLQARFQAPAPPETHLRLSAFEHVVRDGIAYYERSTNDPLADMAALVFAITAGAAAAEHPPELVCVYYYDRNGGPE